MYKNVFENITLNIKFDNKLNAWRGKMDSKIRELFEYAMIETANRTYFNSISLCQIHYIHHFETV